MKRFGPVQTGEQFVDDWETRLICESSAMRRVRQACRQLAPTSATILLQGEAGTGKKLVARMIHQGSRRCQLPWMQLDCVQLELDRLEEVLRQSHGGTLLLTDIDRATEPLQLRLLRELRAAEAEQVSQSDGPRILATTQRDLSEESRQQRFRSELYWRLSSATIHLPPLRDRVEDLPRLLDWWLQYFHRIHQPAAASSWPAATLAALQAYPWPGNVCQLESFVERVVLLSGGGPVGLEWLPESRQTVGQTPPVEPDTVGQSLDFEGLARALVEQGTRAAEMAREELYAFVVCRVEKELIARVLADCEFVQTKAASRLGISRNTLHKKLKEHQIQPPAGAG